MVKPQSISEIKKLILNNNFLIYEDQNCEVLAEISDVVANKSDRAIIVYDMILIKGDIELFNEAKGGITIDYKELLYGPCELKRCFNEKTLEELKDKNPEYFV
jgi:hypothetical protein